MDFEKWVNELQCEIDKIKRKLAALSGGSTVSITPTLESGEKVADYTIDETSGSIYAPEQVNADWNATSGKAQILHQPFKFQKITVTLPANASTIELNIADVNPELATADFVSCFNYTASNAITSIAFNAVRTKMYINFAVALTSQIDYDIVIMAVYGVIPNTTSGRTKTTKKK